MSLYEVSDIVRDESFSARDLVRGGEPIRVSERSGTHYLKPWDRIAARLEPALGALVGEPLIQARTVAELMASPPTDTPGARSSCLVPNEERAVIHATLDQHYMNLLDQPVPTLGNVSPRRAAKSERGRQKLGSWLKYLENRAAQHEAGSPMAGYDLRWMWEELGVADLRR